MKNKYHSITAKLMTLVFGAIFAISLSGCNDTIVADMEGEHIRLSNIARQEFRHALSVNSASLQAKVSYPAPDNKTTDSDTQPGRKLAKSAPLKTIDHEFLERTKYLLE